MAATADHGPSPSRSLPSVVQPGRLVALDRMRGFIVLLVVLHHAILAYCTFGHIDRLDYALSTAPIVDVQRWAGFDLLVRLNDSFFMPLLFLLSGLFVPGGLDRKGVGAFLRDRMLRLGLPFAVAEITVIPLAYYPSYLQAGGSAAFASFWGTTVTTGPWPSGPPWFIGVLLMFDAAAAWTSSIWLRRDPVSADHRTRSPTIGFALLVASLLLYLPLLIAFGPTRWFGVGPLAIQASRIGLYAAYFAAGLALGRGGVAALGRLGETIAARWSSWLSLATLTAAVLVVFDTMLARRPFRLSAESDLALSGAVQAAFCASAALALPALFIRFAGRRNRALDSLAANSFAIYLLHYPFVTWTQYGLLAGRVGAPVKGTVAFSIALAASWTSAWSFRRLPVLGRVL